MRSRGLGTVLLGALCTVAACDGSESDDVVGEELESAVEEVDPALLAVLPEGTSPEMLAEGRRLFVVCSVCHGLDARGTQLGPSLRDETWIHIDGSIPQIADLTQTGVASPAEFPIPMPPMGGGDFNPEQLRSLATYVYAVGRTTS